MAAAGCLDPNPAFNPQLPTASDSADATTTSGATTQTTEATSPTAGAPTSTMSTLPGTTTDSTISAGTTGDVSTGGQPVCGDGVIEGGEACDEGAANDDKGACTPSCTLASCGDGHVFGPTEDCDDGNDVLTDGCIDCKVPRSCEQIQGWVPGASSGVYPIDVDTQGPMTEVPVYCDMDTDGGGWTLIERSQRADPIAVALFQDNPVQMDDPTASSFRLPRGVIEALSSHSPEMRIGCGGEDRLLLASTSFSAGQFDAQCHAPVPVTYAEARVKGQVRSDVVLCTYILGNGDGECTAAWGIVEDAQYDCGELDPAPFGGAQVASEGTALFAVDGLMDQGSRQFPQIHDCHQMDAIRTVMMR